MEVREYDACDREMWDRLVDDEPSAGIFHRWDWLKLAEKHSRSCLHALVCMQGKEPVALVPLFYYRRGPFRTVFSPPPGLAIPGLGPLLLGQSATKAHKLEDRYWEAMVAVDRLIQRMKPHYVSISATPALADVRPFSWLGYDVSPAYTYSINLDKGEDGAWLQFHKKLRSDISRTEAKGLTVKEGTFEDLDCLYDSLKERYGNQGMSLPLSREYLIDVWRQFSAGHVMMLVPEFKGEAFGSSLFISYHGVTSHWMGGAKNNRPGLAVNDVVLWQAIKRAAQRGNRSFELTGANTQRLCEFKSKYSPGLRVYFRAKRTTHLGRIAERLYIGLRRSPTRV